GVGEDAREAQPLLGRIGRELVLLREEDVEQLDQLLEVLGPCLPELCAHRTQGASGLRGGSALSRSVSVSRKATRSADSSAERRSGLSRSFSPSAWSRSMLSSE